MKKVLTYITILAISALPIQLISANVEFVGMQMSMSQQMQASNNECLHEVGQKSASTSKNSCCGEQSQDCQNCNNCPQAVSVLFSLVNPVIKVALLSDENTITSHLILHGVSPKNLLRPPQAQL